jgi:hypothetical protein
MSNPKPVWKRTFDGAVYGDFFDGRGIVMSNPRHPHADADGWLQSSEHTRSWPQYNNEQKAHATDHGVGGVYVYYYSGQTFNTMLSPKQTEAWNEHYNFTPYVPIPLDEAMVKHNAILKRMKQQEDCFSTALARMKAAMNTIENHAAVMQSLEDELELLSQEASE